MDRLMIDDFRACGYCVPGIRAWCKSTGAYDFRTLIKEGMPLDKARELAKTDEHVKMALEKWEANHERRR